jgi:tetratricopeptide (TPR) repeat protein
MRAPLAGQPDGEEETMNAAVLIQGTGVPDEAESLAETVDSFRRFGELFVYCPAPDNGLARSAAALGVQAFELEDPYDEGAIASRMLADHPGRTRLLVHADEIVERIPPVPELEALTVPATATVLHRVNDGEAYNEALQVRVLPPGAGYAATGRYSPKITCDGRVLAAADLAQPDVVFAHYPARWPRLAIDRVRRLIRRIELSVEEEPGDPGHLYQLIYRHWTLNDWDDVLRLVDRWNELPAQRGQRHAMVDYYAACASIARRDIRGARRLVRSALERAAGFADAWYLLAELRRLTRDRAGAVEAFERAAALGSGASPVAVEDYSLATWRPLEALAEMAEADGRAADAAELRRRAGEAHRSVATLRAAQPAELE